MFTNTPVYTTIKEMPGIPVGTLVQIVFSEQEDRYTIWSLGSSKKKKPEYRRKMIGAISGGITPEEFCQYFTKTEYPLLKRREKLFYYVLSEGVEFPTKPFESLSDAKKFAQDITQGYKKDTYIVQAYKKYEYNEETRCVEETQYVTKV